MDFQSNFMSLTPEQIKAMNTRLGITPNVDIGIQNRVSELDNAWSNVPKQKGILNPEDPIRNFGIGALKGAGETLTNIGNVIAKPLGKAMGIPEKEIGLQPEQLKAKNTAQEWGKGAERIAELFLPATKIAKAEKAVGLMIKGQGLIQSLSRVGAKSLISGIGTGAVVTAQTGSIKEGMKAGGVAGGLRGGLAIIGEGARALHLPERLYSTIFKNSAKDMITELKSGGLTTLQQNNPQKFQELVGKGIIKVSKDGSPVLNDTLAEQALDKGLRGSIRSMADEVVHGALDSEDKVQTIANNYSGNISLKEPQFQNVFRKIASEYEDVGFGEIADEANSLADTIKNSGGEVTAKVAVQVKRFLDRVRIATSFDKPVVNLSTSQGNLKTLADAVRSRVNSIPGMGEVMKNYSFYIDALESLAREASRRGNNQVLSLIDSLFLSGAYAGNNPIPGVTMGMLRKLIMSAPGTTYLGQALKNSSVSPLTAGLISGGSAGVQSGLKDQQ